MTETLTTTSCECGCGEQTKPGNRFRHGHNNRHLFGEHAANVRWKDNEAGYSAIHKWLNKHWPLTGTCEECGATGVRTDYSNIDHTWKRDRSDYRELCRRCHIYYDHDELDTPNPCFDRSLAPVAAS